MRRYATVEQRLFLEMMTSPELAADAATAICGGDCSETSSAARLLTEACLLFVCEFGSHRELSLETVRDLISLESERKESALEAMIRQVERGQYYDLQLHDWVDDPKRDANPDSRAVRAFHAYRACEGVSQLQAKAHAGRHAAALASWPGDAALAAALLAYRCDEAEACS